MGEDERPGAAMRPPCAPLLRPRPVEARVDDDEDVREHDDRFMRRALELASAGLGLASPNPMVGAVLVQDGRIVGEGWHEGPGTDHAETMALAAAGREARGATLYVTLEPCSHHGRTPPCAPAVVAGGVTRVVASVRDPNPLMDGRGFEVIRGAGIRVDVGVQADRAERLIEGFAKAVRTGMPFVTLKMAASLDGRVAARDGSSRWVSGQEARRDVHRMRAASDAIVVGAGTAILDDPSLTVRIEGYRGRQPLRVVIDGSGRLPAAGRLFDGAAPALIATTRVATAEIRDAWLAAGAEIHVMRDGDEGSALCAFLRDLGTGAHQVRSVLIEGGPTLAWSAVRAGVVDRF